MTPTMKLRVVERTITVPFKSGGPNFVEIKKVRVLQQWWEPEASDHTYITIEGNHGRKETRIDKIADGVWKDVPLEEEK